MAPGMLGPRPMGPIGPVGLGVMVPMGIGPMGMGPGGMGPMGPMGPMPMGGYPRPMPNQIDAWAPPAYRNPIQPGNQSLYHQGHPGQSGPPNHPGPPEQIGLAGQPMHTQQTKQAPPAVRLRSQGTYSPRNSGGHLKFSSGSAALHPSNDDYQGIPHPRHPAHPLHPSHGEHTLGDHPSLPVFPRRHSRPSSSGVSPGETRRDFMTSKPKHASYPSDLHHMQHARRTSAEKGQQLRHDAWLDEIAGPGQDQQPYPEMKPLKFQTTLSPPEPPVKDDQMNGRISQRDSGRPNIESKRSWGWAMRGRQNYDPVARLEAEAGPEARSPRIGDKRRSWFGRGSDRMSAATRAKQDERERERQGLARESGRMSA